MNILEQIEGLVSTKLEIVKSIFSLIKLEARLAGLSIFPLILNVCILFVVFISLWLSVLGFSCYLLYLVTENIVVSGLSIILVNLILFFGLIKYLSFNLKSMSFQKTREYFSTKESPEHEQLEEKTSGSN